jgi:hypothetical protein
MDTKDECRASRQGHGKERCIECYRFQPKTESASTSTKKKEKGTYPMNNQGGHKIFALQRGVLGTEGIEIYHWRNEK